MTTINDFTEVRAEPERDRWGRYLLPHPETGKKQGWTRATTWAKTCSDTFGLTKWELRMAAVGLAARPDLLAQVSTVTDPDAADAKKLLNTITEDAKEAAGASSRRNLGTALHTMTEHLDAGRDFNIPDAHRADLDAYQAATGHLGMDVDLIERIIVVPEFEVAGTFDRIVELDGTLYVADLKTGRDVSYAMGEISIQLALYAHGSGLWNPASGTYDPMPNVDQTKALVFHLPVGEAQCTIHEVDIEAGWEMAQVCGTVRAWRKRRDLSRTLTAKQAVAVPAATDTEPEHVDPTPERVINDRTAWLIDRIKTIKNNHPERVESLRLNWPNDIARQPPWTDEQIDAISTVLHHHEDAWPDPDPRPATEEEKTVEPQVIHPRLRDIDDPDGDQPTEQGDIDALKNSVNNLDDNRKLLASAWAADGKRAGRPFATLKNMNRRCWSIMRAVLRCAQHLHDDDNPDTLTRAALEIVLGEDLQPDWNTGAVLGSLTTTQADELADIAHRFGQNDKEVATDLVARIPAA